MHHSSAISLRARLVVPVAGEPIDGGIITICRGRITAIGRQADGPLTDLGDVAILPGLVNPHTHLEFSHLRAPLPPPAGSLAAWIRLVIAARQASASGPEPTQAGRGEQPGQAGAAGAPPPPRAGESPAAQGAIPAAIAAGLAESLAAGVTTIGDIATGGWPADAHPAGRVVAFRESIALSEARISAELAAARQFAAARPSGRLSLGLSPHAPYTAHPHLVAQLAALSAEFQLPLAMHLAESREELELLRHGRGPLRDLLTERGMWPEDLFGQRRPLDELARLAVAPRALIIHGNYLDDEEIQFLAQHREQMSVIFCPRTHLLFRHERHPLEAMLAAGVPVALGTDSRVSTPDLSPLAELQSVAAQGYRVAPRQLLEMITQAGAQSLGIADAGTLAPGRRADLAVVRLPTSAANDPIEALCDPATRVVATWLGGQRCWPKAPAESTPPP